MLKDWKQKPGPWALSTGQRGYLREAYEGNTRLLPELEIFGWLHFTEALPGALQPDRHNNAYEIHYLRRGHLRWWVEKDNFEFKPGCVFIVRPGELHGGEEESLQPCEHFWLRIAFSAGNKALPALSSRETSSLSAGYKAITYRTFIASPEVDEFFARILHEHRQPGAPDSTLMARSILHALLITLLRDHDRHVQTTRQPPMHTWRIRRTMEWLARNLYTTDIQLDDLARELDISPSGLRTRFKEETGFTPHEYILRQKMEEARRQLAESENDVTRIALDLGFSSSQYFATVFKKFTGLSPQEYRTTHKRRD